MLYAIKSVWINVGVQQITTELVNTSPKVCYY